MLNFWERVNKLIDSQNTKQSWVADKTGILQQTLSQWMIKDRLPDADDAFKIAELFNVTVEYQVTGKHPAGLSDEEKALLDLWRRIDPAWREEARQALADFQARHPLAGRSGLSNEA